MEMVKGNVNFIVIEDTLVPNSQFIGKAKEGCWFSLHIKSLQFFL